MNIHSPSNECSAEAEALILWPPDAKNWLSGKDPDVGKDWRQEDKGMTEDEMVGWCHLFDGHEFEQAPWIGDGQGSLVCCSPWDHKESDTTVQLKWNAWIIHIENEILKFIILKSNNTIGCCLTQGYVI